MKKLKYLLIGAFIILKMDCFSQVGYDTFNFTNAKMNYLLNVSRNDNRAIRDTIKNIAKLDTNNYIITIKDSTHILIQDTSINEYIGKFIYYVYNNTTYKDSFIVTFTKSSSNTLTYYNNETNIDSIINHFDIFQIGINYNLIGSPRLLTDTGLSPNLYKRAFWNQSNIISNAATADLNGDGIINNYDLNGIELNYNKTFGTYKPKLSPSSTTNKLYPKIAIDTIVMDTPIKKLSIPIVLHLTAPTSFYGLGYSYSIKYYDLIQKKYVDYLNHNFTNTKPWQNDTLLNRDYFDNSKIKKDILYCKSTGQNEPVIDTIFGVVDIVVEEVLIGIPNPGDITTLVVEVFDIAMIDNKYNLLPLSPLKDTVKVVNKEKKPHASIINQNSSDILVYPTIFQNDIIVRNSRKEALNIKIYDMMGRILYQDIVKETINKIHLDGFNSGIYFLSINEKNNIFKLIKN